MPNLIGQSIGRYHILEQLGEGGMANVYKAYDTRLETKVAVKVIRIESFPQSGIEQALKRFEREAKTLAMLTHPNIVPIIDYGEFEGSPYLVMKYLPGGTLKEQLGKPVPWREAAHLLTPIARALAYAHQQGILHRDVKPSNIMITATGDPMLTDFGIAKILETDETQGMTRPGTGIGTPEYMAPEQAKGEKVDARADVYSLGIVFFEMVTGRKPFTADTPMAVIIKQINDPLPNPRGFVHNLPENVEQVILKALAKQPENRNPDMNAFAKALDAITSAPEGNQDQTIPVYPKPSPPEPPRPLPTWWPWAVGVGGLLIVAIIVGFVLSHRPPPNPANMPTSIQPPIVVETSASKVVATAIETEAPSPSPIPTLGPGSIQVRPTDNMKMVYVPKSKFTMGETLAQAMNECQKYESDCQQDWFTDEQPPHEVTLDAYWIDMTEVTNAMYALCVHAGTCQPPKNLSSHSRSNYYNDQQYSDYPAIYVTWEDARSYCEWAGARLPTEAEWENAARAPDGRIYPWGDQMFNSELANFSTEDTKAVGSYPAGASAYGILDMSGNVWEWMNDWYSSTYYSISSDANPSGPASTGYRVIRGGSWKDKQIYIRAPHRFGFTPSSLGDDLGFRCARSGK